MILILGTLVRTPRRHYRIVDKWRLLAPGLTSAGLLSLEGSGT